MFVEMNYVFLGILLILSGGIVACFFPDKYKGKIHSLFTFAGCSIIIYISLYVLINNITISQQFKLSHPIGNLNIVIDPLSSIFLSLISLLSILCSVYSIEYLKKYFDQNKMIGTHYFLLSILIVSMIFTSIVQNTLAFLIIWEIMSLSSFFLVIFENDNKKVLDAGINYLIAMHIGVLFIIIGFLLLYIKTGSFDFDVIKVYLRNNQSLGSIVFILLFIGFGTKAGFIPFHTWLPKAHPAGPSHISAIMSGIMIKMGIYGILRFLSFIGTPSLELTYLILGISIITGILGIMYAILQHDLKKLLAYSSVENIGIIGIGIGIGMLGMSIKNELIMILGFSGAILHVINHSIFKSLLFLSAGAVYNKTHTKNIEELGGLINKMPYTSLFFLIASIAVCGLPPFNGFISEFIIYFGSLNGVSANNQMIVTISSVISIGSLSLIGVMAIICFTKVFGVVFLGMPRSQYKTEFNEANKYMTIPMSALTILIMLIGLFPHYSLELIKSSVINVTSSFYLVYSNSVKPLHDTFSSIYQNKVIDILSNISIGLMIFLGIVVLMYLIKKILLHKRIVSTYKTWDCGYQAGNSRIQYTASSYAKPFTNIFKPFLKIHVKKLIPKNIFPEKAFYRSHSYDLIELYLINPIIKILYNFIQLFYWIKGGSTKQYILYVILSIIISIIWIIWC